MEPQGIFVANMVSLGSIRHDNSEKCSIPPTQWIIAIGLVARSTVHLPEQSSPTISGLPEERTSHRGY